ncbi:MAG: ACT domain-containing protein [Anaerolineales bacterium]|nr:ACT domain-containing protein [Anaerolineales bacterium]
MTQSDPSGVSDLSALLQSMHPALIGRPFVFASIPRQALAGLAFIPMGTFCESEGVTVIATQTQARNAGWPAGDAWGCITLMVHSSLHAVGFLAAITSALAREGISVNPVSGYYHDHLFVPWEDRMRAMAVLTALGKQPPKAG